MPFSDGSTRKRRKTTVAKPSEERDELVSVIKDAVAMMGATTTKPPETLDEYEHFAFAIALGLKSIPDPMVRERTKLRMQELLFEARFLEC